MQKVIIMNDIWFWGILASITGIAIMISVIKHKKSVSTIKNGTYLHIPEHTRSISDGEFSRKIG